jgi:3-oxoacyl-[acyl-carrier-protein] synthase-3
MRCRIRGIGHALPKERVESRDIEMAIGLSQGWIEQRTGIVERRVVRSDQATSDLAIEAGRNALDDAGTLTSPIAGLILATSTPDHLLPPTAPRVASELGLGSIPAFDMAVACSGFVYGLVTAQALIQTFNAPFLLIAANVLSKRVDPQDAATRALFADAAGAVVVEPTKLEVGLLASHLESDGSAWECLHIPAGGSREPFGPGTWESNRHTMKVVDGKRAFRFAVEGMARCAREVLAQADLGIEQIDWWVPHQANQRIIDEVQKRLGVPRERTVSVIRHLGNSSAATIPVACSLWRQDAKLKPGDLVLLTAAGAGLTCGAALIRW